MADKEKLPRKDKEWLELCEWLEINIFNYHIPEQRLQTDACLVLQGLRKGKAVGNNAIEDNGCYPWNIILLTFKANKTQIQNAIKGKNFDNSERKKMTYICTMVKDKINDIYSRYLNAQKTQEKVESVDVSAMANDGAEYQTTKRKSNKRLDGLW